MQPETTSFPCFKCGTPVNVEPILQALAARHGTYCPGCLDSITAQKTQDRVRAQAGQLFTKLCPPCFPDTDMSRLPCQTRTTSALAWKYGSKGLNLWGWHGTGKTRTMSLILQRQTRAGRHVLAMGPDTFRAQCEARDYKRSHWLRRLSTVDILYFDDFDKQNLTRGMEKDLFGVLNNRMGRRPVMTTGNTPGDQLARQFHLGGPMVDRIRRYCVNIHFGKDGIGA